LLDLNSSIIDIVKQLSNNKINSETTIILKNLR